MRATYWWRCRPRRTSDPRATSARGKLGLVADENGSLIGASALTFLK